MSLSIKQLIKPVSRDAAVRDITSLLSNLGFAATSWQDGSIQKDIITAGAYIFASASEVVATIAENAYNATATGAWLDLITEGWFYDQRQAAVPTRGIVLLTNSGGTGYTPAAGDVLLSDRENAEPYPDGTPANIYRSDAAITIPANGTVEASFTATSPGARGNIAPNTTLYLVTPLADVTATIPPDPSTQTWITRVGEDLESDTRRRANNAAKWDLLAYGSPPNAYVRRAFEADATVTRAFAYSTGGGGVTVVCATAAGGISTTQETAIKEYIDAKRRPINDAVTVSSASVVSVALTCAPVFARSSGTVAKDIERELDAYAGGLDIGGAIVAPSSTGAVIRDEIIETIMKLPGARRASVSAPAADVSLSADEVVVFDYTIAITYED